MHSLQSPTRPYPLIRMDHHEVPPLSPAYVPNTMKLDEYVLVYVPKPKHPEYHAPSDDDIQVEDQPYADGASLTAESPRYIADSDKIGEDDDEDLEEDPSKEREPEDDDEDLEEDLTEEHEPEDEDTKEEEPSECSDETESFEEDETAALIDALVAGLPPFLLPPTSPAYDQAPLESSAATTARAPRGQYDFVDTILAGQSLVRSPGHDARTIARAVDRAEDVGQESKHFYTQLYDAQTDRRDIRLEIDVGTVGTIGDSKDLHESYGVAAPEH
nr:hypothetical protein [Tanacetum cinerariifolium]